MRLQVLVFSGVLLAGGCSGGPHAHSVPPTLPQSAQTRVAPGDSAPVGADDGLATTLIRLSIGVKVPIGATGARSVGVSANGASWAFVDVSATSSGCVKSTGSIARTCTARLNAPAGSDTFSLKSFDGASGTGTLLASATVRDNISATSANALKLVLGGTVSSIRLALMHSEPLACSGSTMSPLLTTAFDNERNVILGSYANTVTFTDSDTSGNTSIAPRSARSSSTVASVTYRGRPIAATFGALAAGVPSASVTSAALAPTPLLYAVNAAGHNPASVTIYPATANGNVTPLRKIQGANTRLNAPRGVAHDSFCDLWVSDSNPFGVLYKFAAGANGNVAPIATVTGSSTGLYFPLQLAIDRMDRVYVANQTNVLSFAPTADGNAAPLRSLTSGALDGPYGIAVDTAGKIYVASVGNGHGNVAIFAPSANGLSAPIALIAGSRTGLQSPVAVAVDGTGKTYVSDINNRGRVTVFASGVSGNVVPTATITTSSFGAYGIAVDSAGLLFYAIQNDFNRGGDGGSAVFAYPPGANGSGLPTATIDGINTGLNESGSADPIYISL